jgi:hypothetical protein
MRRLKIDGQFCREYLYIDREVRIVIRHQCAFDERHAQITVICRSVST